MSARRNGSMPKQPAERTDDRPGTAARALSRVIERGSRVQRPAVRAYLDRLRNADPGASPADIAARLEKRYLRAITLTGVAVGATAAFPGIGTLAAFAVVASETVLFLEATALFVLALAEIHNIPAEHREQRRALVLAVLAGDAGKRAVVDLIGPGRTGGAWLSESAATLPLPMMSELNSRLLRYFVKRYTLRRSALTIGKLLPVGLGAVIGAVGNRIMGKKIVSNAGDAFGPPPAHWPVALHLLPPVRDVS